VLELSSRISQQAADGGSSTWTTSNDTIERTISTAGGSSTPADA
jgi:hypothetical protein